MLMVLSTSYVALVLQRTGSIGLSEDVQHLLPGRPIALTWIL